MFYTPEETNLLSLLQLGWNKIYLVLSVHQREDKVVSIIQTQMIALRTADELRDRNVKTFGFGENNNISILLFLLSLLPLEDGMIVVHLIDRNKEDC